MENFIKKHINFKIMEILEILSTMKPFAGHQKHIAF